MARLSNHIEDYILGLLLEEDGRIEIKRNVLAEHFGCAPSQINYVLTTRFTPVQGFFVESRRGGGGFIRIVKVELNDEKQYFDLLNEEVGTSITQSHTNRLLKSLEERGVEILSCGTCLNFYGITEKLRVGSVTNMYTILERQMKATRVIKP